MGLPVNPYTQRSAHLLLIEGRASTRDQIYLLLEPERAFLMTNFPSGLEAAGAARQLKPEIVLIDQHLPDSDGLTMSSVIRHLLPQSCVVLLVDSAKHIEAARVCGASETIVKSNLATELVPTLRRLLATAFG